MSSAHSVPPMSSTSTESRPLLPLQQGGMSNISFAPPNMGPQNDKKNYVFVDEHNRHRRLKVVRACDGCRRRKIKCDSATTNQWPCAACNRLKLQCVPPAVNYERNGVDQNAKFGMQGVLDFDQSDMSGDEDYVFHQDPHAIPWDMQGNAHVPMHAGALNPGTENVFAPQYPAHGQQQDFSIHDLGLPVDNHAYEQPQNYDIQPKQPSMPRSDSSWSQGEYGNSDLSEMLGELRISANGVAPYISSQKKALAEAPAYEEAEAKIPRNAGIHGSSVRIPQEWMPSDEQCLKYFDIFFTHIHPYVPVISKPYFYQQWKTNRRTISPLILEAIFASTARMSDDASKAPQWLALSSNHEECFMDVPRLSTVQAMMILLKARESYPKRGYYYRSWITIKKIITMALDLDLHEHLEIHKNGGSCGSDPTECLVKTRIWQSIFTVETMVGAPQGRIDMGVDPDTVDLDVLRPVPGIESSDYQISRQFTYLVRKIALVRKAHDLKGKLKDLPADKTSDWSKHPQFIELAGQIVKWIEGLPRDLQINFPNDDTVPWVPSHFVGNLHAYFHLTRVMVHRPQIMDPASYVNGSWKVHMAACSDSSKKMCKLQEAILQNFGINGLLCMQRGINFTIYSVLTCTMVHLVAMTSPDPDINSDARDYFTRHMRILEQCNSAWPQQDMQKQINALREAFSADITRPFELKTNLGLSPSPGPSVMQPSPPLESKYQIPMLTRQTSPQHIQQTSPYQGHPLTPPMTAGLDAHSNSHSLDRMSNMPLSDNHTNGAHQAQPTWNPAPIFEGWNAAFGENSASMADITATVGQQSPPLYPPTMGIPNDAMLNTAPNSGMQNHYAVAPEIPPLPQQTPQISTNPTTEPSFVSSSMWRDSIANAFDRSGLKRGWDDQSSYFSGANVAAKRAR